MAAAAFWMASMASSRLETALMVAYLASSASSPPRVPIHPAVLSRMSWRGLRGPSESVRESRVSATSSGRSLRIR